jgi:hypothetical protein
MTEQKKSFFAANWFKLFFVAITLIALLVYFNREFQLDDCLMNAHKNYSERWDAECAKEKKKPDCELALFNGAGAALNQMKDKHTDECFRRYGWK